MPTLPTFEIEQKIKHELNVTLVCGIDEAGRGPLAGRVYAASVILPDDFVLEGLNDSKKLSEKKRELFFDIIREKALSCAVAFAESDEIDSMNILNATMLAMRRAVSLLDPQPQAALVDGSVARGFEIPATAVVKGDSLSMSIAAASVLAKVSRDRYCMELDALYPQYRFAVHKGYPTKEHMELVRKYGPCPAHRRSFLGFLSKKPI